MKFVVDECVGSKVARWLAENKHDVFSIYDEACGVKDDFVLQKALKEERILITMDKDFGEMVFRCNQGHSGVILLRLFNEHSLNKINKLKWLLENYSEQLPLNFVVVSEKSVRIVHLT